MKKLYVLTVGALALAWLASCSGEQKPQGAQMPPSRVNTVKVELKEIPVSYEYAAIIKSIKQVDVRSKVQGTLLKKAYDEGSFVKAGSALFVIDPAKYKAVADAARANLHLAKAKASQANAEFERINGLFRERAVSQKEADAALANAQIAQANVQSARAGLKNAALDLDYTMITAPISGVTGMSEFDVGSFVSSGAALMRITQLDPIYAEFSIPDSQRMDNTFNIKDIQDGKLQAQIVFSNAQNYEQNGRVNFLDAVIDKTTSSVKARAVFENKDHKLLPGQFVRVKIVSSKTQKVVSIPQIAILQNGSTTFVYVVRDGKATVAPVKISRSVGDEFIVEAGLKEGDEIIINNLTKLRPNAPVIVEGK